MFWRKKADKKAFFEYRSNSRRHFVRVRPGEDRPVTIRFDDHEKPAITISAGGFSFQNRGYVEGDVIPATFSIPDCPKLVSTDITIVDVCRYDRCHCSFTKIREADRELIHQYCLTRQKELIAQSKQDPRPVPPPAFPPTSQR